MEEGRYPSVDAVRYWTVLSASSVLKHLWLGQAREFNIPNPIPILLPPYRPFTLPILPSSSCDIRINIFHCCKHRHNVQTKSQTRIHSNFTLKCKDALLSLKKHYPYVNNWIIDFSYKTDVSGAETRFWILRISLFHFESTKSQISDMRWRSKFIQGRPKVGVQYILYIIQYTVYLLLAHSV